MRLGQHASRAQRIGSFRLASATERATNRLEKPPGPAFRHRTTPQNRTAGRQHYGNVIAVRSLQRGVGVDINHRYHHTGSGGILGEEVVGLIADRAVASGHERQHTTTSRAGCRVSRLMRPVTAAVVVGLLALIVGAFLWQLYVADVLF